MLALIPLLPFAGFVVNAMLGRRLPKSVSGGLASRRLEGAVEHESTAQTQDEREVAARHRARVSRRGAGDVLVHGRAVEPKDRLSSSVGAKWTHCRAH